MAERTCYVCKQPIEANQESIRISKIECDMGGGRIATMELKDDPPAHVHILTCLEAARAIARRQIDEWEREKVRKVAEN